MKRREQRKFIKRYILPYETKENILMFYNGILEYDEEYLKEVKTNLNIK
jgi:hypothetical protein